MVPHPMRLSRVIAKWTPHRLRCFYSRLHFLLLFGQSVFLSIRLYICICLFMDVYFCLLHLLLLLRHHHHHLIRFPIVSCISRCHSLFPCLFIRLRICLCVCLSVCLCLCLSVSALSLSVCLSLSVSVCLS